MPSADRSPRPAAETGFTLLEALVALAVLAVAAAGLLRAAEGHVDRITQLEARAGAYWAAEAVLADLELGRRPTETSEAAIDMAGRAYRATVLVSATDDPEILRVDLEVRADGGRGVLASLTGFLDRGASS